VLVRPSSQGIDAAPALLACSRTEARCFQRDPCIRRADPLGLRLSALHLKIVRLRVRAVDGALRRSAFGLRD